MSMSSRQGPPLGACRVLLAVGGLVVVSLLAMLGLLALGGLSAIQGLLRWL